MRKNETFRAIPTNRIFLIRGLLLATILCLAIGLITPMMTMTKFYVFDNSFSVISGIYELFISGQYLLFIIVSAFSILLPLLKIYVLFRLVGQKSSQVKLQRYLHLMHEYGRWAMLDVLVVAVLIVTVKLGAVASIEVHYGLYVFGVAVLALMFITNWVVKLTNPQEYKV